jgi:aminoglycoside phosphotransferase (APT) family kinase protein
MDDTISSFSPEFDAAAKSRLGAWLNSNGMSGSGEPQLQKFAGGQSNPTYRLSWGGRDFVLRRRPFGTLLPKAHMIEREFKVLDALRRTNGPVCLPWQNSTRSRILIVEGDSRQ